MNDKTKQWLRRAEKRLCYGRLNPLCQRLLTLLSAMEYAVLSSKWWLQGLRRPKSEDVELVKKNVTFFYKSFERQKMAAQLYRNIQRYYPGVRVVIADDSAQPLSLRDEYLEVIQLPFNSGLSYGLNRALERVKTPFVIRMDDDELLTLHTRFHDQLRWLLRHPEADLVAVLHVTTPLCKRVEKVAAIYYPQTMAIAPKPLKLPHRTPLDGRVVMGKPPNVFLARTQALRAVGYDDKIRMLDHNEFFFRAAGELLCVMDPKAFVFHRHNRYDLHYGAYRSDVEADRRYIRAKMLSLLQKQRK